MLRYLRLNFFAAMDAPPMAVVVREDSLKIDIERARDQQIAESVSDGGFVVWDIFEDEGTTLEVTRRTEASVDKNLERNMAVMFFWTVGHFPLLKKGGAVLPNPAAPNYPAPMSAEQAEKVMWQMALHKDYRPDITVEMHTEDGGRLKLYDGKVEQL